MANPAQIFDLLIVGAGINGAGIARDAAGRGLRVALVERGDLAGATSSASSKLIHGGLRYLEQGQFRLVREALAEREVLLSICGHLAWPLAFVLPHAPGLRPRWMLRAGLFVYDRLGGGSSLPRSRTIDLDAPPYRAILKPEFEHGFVYSDAWVDDARLVVANVRDAVDRSAALMLGFEAVSARRCTAAALPAGAPLSGSLWQVGVRDVRTGSTQTLHARALVNAGGPWAGDVYRRLVGNPLAADRAAVGATGALGLKHVKGSHIVVPRLYAGDQAYILQHTDRRIVFLLPFAQHFTLIGTTDVDVHDYSQPEASAAEVDYLCALVNRYTRRSICAADVIWRYSGVRALVEDGNADASAVTRDYSLHVDGDVPVVSTSAPSPSTQHDGAFSAAPAPLLSVLGGKITTYRALAEAALDRLGPWFPAMRPAWTAHAALPGADLGDAGYAAFRRALGVALPQIDAALLDGLARRHGTLTERVLDGATTNAALGRHFGGGLYQRELDYLLAREWAAECAPGMATDAVLWRRTKCGLAMRDSERRALADYLGEGADPRPVETARHATAV